MDTTATAGSTGAANTARTANAASTTPARTTGAALARLASPVRLVGYTLYNTWLLSTFYNTFLFLSAGEGFRDALYMNQMLSLGVLALALLVLPIALPRTDKRVLSRRFSQGAGAVLAVFTALLAFADPATLAGDALIVASSVGTGLASGALFLGWGRLYADVGTRLAMFEIALTWVLAGLIEVALSLVPGVVATVVVVAGAFVSAVLLRRAALSRPARPQPARPHKLQARTKRMFARGLVACAGMGLVAGFSDILTGYEFVAVAEGYEIMLALSCAIVAAAVTGIVLASRHDFVTYVYRLVTLLLATGCLLTPFVFEGSHIFSNVVVFGAYMGFVVVLSVVCMDISNYFDQPATRTFGLAFFALYLGELVGNGVGNLVVDVLAISTAHLNIVGLVLTMAVVFANLFLFTEKDLTETSLGEMTDGAEEFEELGDFEGRGRGGIGLASAGAAGGGAGSMGAGAAGGLSSEQRTVRITALLTARFGLTPREAEVLPLIIKGRTIARIQEELHISQGTVSTHTRHIYQKTNAHNRQALLDMIDAIPDKELAAVEA